jgi:hypothetical protein|nr:MAG TPA: hypothetical protein [Caudoviricetes sp.]
MKTVEELSAENKAIVEKLVAVQYKALDRLVELGLGLDFWDTDRFGDFIGYVSRDKIQVYQQPESEHILLFRAEDTYEGEDIIKAGSIWDDILEDDFDVEEEIKIHLSKLNVSMTAEYMKLDMEKRSLGEKRDKVVNAVNSLGINIYDELYKRRDSIDA